MASTTTYSLPRTTRQQTTYNVVCGLGGFLGVFGLAHLLLVEITKTSGYVFFGVLLVVPTLIGLLAARLAPDTRAAFARFGWGALMCVCAIPAIYLARFFPEAARQTTRNLLGLPFFALAVIGPFWRARKANVR